MMGSTSATFQYRSGTSSMTGYILETGVPVIAYRDGRVLNAATGVPVPGDPRTFHYVPGRVIGNLNRRGMIGRVLSTGVSPRVLASALAALPTNDDGRPTLHGSLAILSWDEMRKHSYFGKTMPSDEKVAAALEA